MIFIGIYFNSNMKWKYRSSRGKDDTEDQRRQAV